MDNNSFSAETDINNDYNDYSEDYEVNSISKYFNLKEKAEKYEFEQAFYNSFHSKESTLSDFDDEEIFILFHNSNQNKEKSNSSTEENILIDNSEKNNINNDNDNDNENNIIGNKHDRNKNRFKVNKINPKREIAFTTFNSKFNKYLNEVVNNKIKELTWDSKFYFTDENPLLSTKFTQCGIQKTLKKYLKEPIKNFIKDENFDKIKKLGIENDSLFNSRLCDYIFTYYEYIYSNMKEFNKYLEDKKFVIRNENFSKNGLINLKYQEDYIKIYGYLDFFKIDLKMKGSISKNRFNISNNKE
jgi:hypothetical protein